MASDNKTIVKEEVIDVVDYDPEVYGPPPRLPRKYYGEQKIGDQQVIFFYEPNSETDESDIDIEQMPRPYKVKVRKVNDIDDQFVCVYPLVDETVQLQPRLPRAKHLKLFDEAMIDRPQPLLTQMQPPQVTAEFQPVRHNVWSSSVRTAAVEVSFHAPPQRRFLNTNATCEVPTPQPTLSLVPQPEQPLPTNVPTLPMEDIELEARLLDGLPELTDDELNMFFSP